MQPKPYDCFCPKLLAGIHNGFMPETILDRSIPFKLRRKKPGEQCDRFHAADVAESGEVESLLNRVDAFVATYGPLVGMQRPGIIQTVNDRQNEICEPLLALAAVFGVEDQAREDIRDMFASMTTAPNALQRLLASIRAALGDKDRIHTETLLPLLDPPTNGRMLGVWLEPLHIYPDQLRIGNRSARGYRRADFESAFERYLAPQ
jgi:hypothetical protein